MAIEEPPIRLDSLPERLQRVLLAVLREYVETAEPVASRRVAERSGLRVSPATIRGAMAALSELGLLDKPHSSAGRLPTEQAFRLYVDQLIEATAELEAPNPTRDEEFEPGLHSAVELVQRLAEDLSLETGQLAFVVNRESSELRLSHVHFVRVSSERVMAVLVGTTGGVQQRIVEERECSQRDLDRISARLSEYVAGLTLGEAHARLELAIERERASRDQLQAAVLALGEATLAPVTTAADSGLYVGDRQPLLQQPEFADAARLRQVLATLEEKERMLDLLDQVLAANGLHVRIGRELDAPGMQECALVTASVGEGLPVTGVGVIGPVRMRYDVVIPVVRAVSARMRDAFTR